VVTALGTLFLEIAPQQVRAIAVDGTSSTLLLCDNKGVPLTPALMYNDSRAQRQAGLIATIAPKQAGGHGASSSLAKLLWMQENNMDDNATHAVHQADWILGKLAGEWGVSDYNNCLKLGYDVGALCWPDWFSELNVNTALLPKVKTPGTTINTVSKKISRELNLRPDTEVIAGTSDGVAAFLAAGATRPGQAVTSLGSTLVLKLLSRQPVFSPEHGVYSHRLGNYWLVGGASNSGGAVLLQHFKQEQLQEMTSTLNPDVLLNLNYYPLPGIGERFPVNDPDMTGCLEPLPDSNVAFFQGILEGIAHIEAKGYRLLTELGAPEVTEIMTTGGGSKNPAWTSIRERITGIRQGKAHSDMAAYGTALLATGIIEKQYL